MSIMYCEKHDRKWDSDKLDECPLCENSEIEPSAMAADKGWKYETAPMQGFGDDLAPAPSATHAGLVERLQHIRLAQLEFVAVTARAVIKEVGRGKELAQLENALTELNKCEALNRRRGE